MPYEVNPLDWVTAIAASGTMVITGLALLFARAQLSQWRDELKVRRASEAALELILAAEKVSEGLKWVRASFVERQVDEASGELSEYQRRFEQVHELSKEFADLRINQIRARYVLSCPKLDAAVEELFQIRIKIIVALKLIYQTRFGCEEKGFSDDDVRLRQDIFGSYGKYDQLGLRQEAAMLKIHDLAGPYAKLEVR
ncbi:hypothetical protein [Qingshengfaniella alkalisoli]|uniref:Uncharacterized protein n=1 Tax=Qingshengfaniella alkalisoli TaxID=2599296 RepID=A0A5B8J2X3_9RHOB|nr:hypothetical protein [Qingshengfaniella alkalisoli]QDY68610.1 hypothetical protein FPZ52_02565 [Qingshengfaniella alkalisoli]